LTYINLSWRIKLQIEKEIVPEKLVDIFLRVDFCDFIELVGIIGSEEPNLGLNFHLPKKLYLWDC
jgi:hypothetical protein